MSKKITQLTELTTPDDADQFVVVDTEVGSTKRITRANMLANAVGSAELESNAVTTVKITDGNVTPAKWTNPYKFYAYNNSSSSGAVAGTFVPLQAELFDTNNNYDVTTYRYTAPVTGFYQFNGRISLLMDDSNTAFSADLVKNGTSSILFGASYVNMYAGAYSLGLTVNGLVQLTAGDYVNLRLAEAHPGGSTINLGAINTYLSGFLVSIT